MQYYESESVISSQEYTPKLMAITGHSPPLDKGFQVHRLDRPLEHKGCHGIWDLVSSPINVSRVLSYLQEYPKHDVVIELGEGVKNGFRLNYTGPIRIDHKN